MLNSISSVHIHVTQAVKNVPKLNALTSLFIEDQHVTNYEWKVSGES